MDIRPSSRRYIFGPDPQPPEKRAKPIKTDSGPNRAERRAAKKRGALPTASTSPATSLIIIDEHHELDPLSQQRLEAFCDSHALANTPENTL